MQQDGNRDALHLKASQPEASTERTDGDSKPPRPPLPVRKPASTLIDRLGDAIDDSVDVVVCVHNALDDVRRCLESVQAHTTGNHRLVIVNDGSDEETTDYLRGFCGAKLGVRLIETHGPLGYTRAANMGLSSSICLSDKADHMVLLNSDTVVPPLWLERMLECMTSEDGIGIVGPLSNAASWQSVPEVVGADRGWAVNQLPPGYDVRTYAELVASLSERTFPKVDFVNGFCFMVRRAVLESVGLLDEAAFPKGYGEENDYCLRAADAGFALAIADHCYVYHAKSRSFGAETRKELARQGSAALTKKHGSARIDEATARLRATPALEEMRRCTAGALVPEKTAAAGKTVAPGKTEVKEGALGVLFVMPVRGGAGGAHSVVQETMGMRRFGVDARVAVDEKFHGSFTHHYSALTETNEVIVFYRSQSELFEIAKSFEVIVATLWSSPALIAPFAASHHDKLYVYYVQDYEPWFFAEGSPERQQALDSYAVVPSMHAMAKTQWLCRTVGELHDIKVHQVAPSLDHAVYSPRPAAANDVVVLAAMIRPTTPRRGPLRTLKVFREVSKRLLQNAGDVPFRLVLFGCEDLAITKYVAGTDPEFRMDFPYENRGVLTREGVAELLREACVFADLSDYQAFGRTGLEALACGCAVVLPDVGGVREYAEHGENALLVDTTSEEAMVEALVQLATDESLRRRLVERGLKTAARYSIERASLSELAVFRSLLARQQRSQRRERALV